MGLSRLDAACVRLATGMGISYIAASGKRRGWTWSGAGLLGTLEGLALWPLLPSDRELRGMFVAGAVLAACWICGRAAKALGTHDDPLIVLDEVVGVWVAVAWQPVSLAVAVPALILFRAFDAGKPPPCRWLEKLPGGWGVVMDDVGAGLLAAGSLELLGRML